MFKNFLFLLVLGTSAAWAQVKAPAPSPASKLTQTVGLTDVTVEYSRPSMKGRKVFGVLVPFGDVWRTGANANTKVTFDDDVVINGDTLKKGTYALYTKPNAENWEVYFYTDTNNWGNPQQWDDSKVALKTAAKVEKMAMPVETFTISIDDLTNDSGVLGMLWENTYVGVPFQVPTDARTMASIDKIMSGPGANDYYGAASYYRKAGKDLKQALTWINKATDMNKDAFWMMHEKAQILAALGDKKGAIEAAKKSMEAAQKSEYPQNIKDEYTKMNQDAIAKWSK
ncbi:MAG: DUF2911 domain-containing protein [Flavobacteriaceae bacterium]|nr:DUF2911 domain-containing protein [Flavobacteriaceae bacterium]